MPSAREPRTSSLGPARDRSHAATRRVAPASTSAPEAVLFVARPAAGRPNFGGMPYRHRRPQPLPSFGPRRVRCPQGSVRLVIDELFASEHRPVRAELQLLERFSALMAAQGWPAHVSRLAYDRIYAGERFGFAKRVGHGALPALARQLLEHWQASRQARG